MGPQVSNERRRRPIVYDVPVYAVLNNRGEVTSASGQPFWEHMSPTPTVNPEQCPLYCAHSGSPQVQSVHWPALGTGRHAHWEVPSAGLRTFTSC